MAVFACLPTMLVGKKKKSKGISKAVDGSKKGSSNGDLRVKPIDLVRTSTENSLEERNLTVSISTPEEKKVLDDRLARAESTGEATYKWGNEHYEIRIMKRDYSDLDLQLRGELASFGSNTNLSNYVLENSETDKEIAAEAMISVGHVSYPGMERAPVLKRSCSNIETMQAKPWTKSPKMSRSYSNLQSFSGNNKVIYETHSSPLSVRTSCSADRVMLKRQSSSEVLPSRSRKIWWKLFLWSNRNIHKPRAPQRLVSVLSALHQKNEYSSDTHEPGQNLDNEKKKPIEPENQWVEFSLGSSHMDRVNAWVNSLEDCSFFVDDVEEHCYGMEDEKTCELQHLEIGESAKICSHTSQRVAEEVAQANNIIHSLNSFSSVAHISGIGLKVIPSISSFLCLRTVNLSGNCIVHITPGCLPKSLHTLDLSRNKISTIEGLRDLERLRVLNLSYNRISRIDHGLSSCTLIKELYLVGNKISNVEGLHRLLKLTVLDLSFNKITTAKALGQLVANYNSLLALNLLGNPIQSNIGDDQLRKAVLSLLPHVTFLNKQPIKPHKVREIVTESVAKAALGDATWSSRRKLTKRLNQGSGSSPKSKVGEGSFRASSFRTSKHTKSRHSTPDMK